MPIVTREDGADIWWDAEGSGPPVLLIMGLAYPAEMWFRVLPGLAAKHRVVVLDNRGAGHTGDVVGAPYTVEVMTADCLAVLDAAGVDRAHVVGISMGGLMAQEIVLTARSRVLSLTLMASHAGAAHLVLDPEALALLQGRAGMTPQQAAEASIPFNYAPTTPRAVIEQDWSRRFPLASSNAGYLAQGGTMAWSGLDRLPGLTVATLVVQGELDRLIPMANAQKLVGAIPGAELAVVPGANHLLTSDQPDAVVDLLLDWFARNPA